MISLSKSSISRHLSLITTISCSASTRPAHLHHQLVKSSSPSNYNLIVLHGLLGSSNNFRSIVSNPTVKSKVNSYLLDLRNHGSSEHKSSMNIREMAEDVAHFIREKRLENLIIMGHSLGGKVSMSLATDFPELFPFIKAMVVMDIAPVNYFSDPKRNNDLIRNNLTMLRNLLGVRLENKMYAELRKEIFKLCPSKEIGELVWTNILHDTKSNKHKWRINLGSIVEYYNKIIEYVPSSEKYYQGCLKVFRGEKSDYILERYYKNFTDIFKKMSASSDIITIKDAGHWIHFEKPYDVINQISAVLDLAKNSGK